MWYACVECMSVSLCVLSVVCVLVSQDCVVCCFTTTFVLLLFITLCLPPTNPCCLPPSSTTHHPHAPLPHKHTHSLILYMLHRVRRQQSVPEGDLISSGLAGLRLAATRYDPAKGTRFSTAAAMWIGQHMQRSK